MFGPDEVNLKAESKFRKNQVPLKSESKAKITFMYKSMTSENLKTMKDCHWEMLD